MGIRVPAQHQTSPFMLGSGETKTIHLAFPAASVGVDNPTNFYFHLRSGGFGAWVKPYTLGAVVPVNLAADLTVSSLDTPGGTAALTGSSQIATCLAYQDAQAYSSGYPSGGTPQSVFARQVGAGGQTIVAGQPGQTIQVWGILFSVDTGGAGGFALVSDDTVTQIVAQVQANTVESEPFTPASPIPLGVGKGLRVSILTAGNCAFSIAYTQS